MPIIEEIGATIEGVGESFAIKVDKLHTSKNCFYETGILKMRLVEEQLKYKKLKEEKTIYKN